MTAHSELVARLEGASEGSRSLDQAVELATGNLPAQYIASGGTYDTWKGNRPGPSRSLDAALALAERVHPGKGWERLYAGLMNWRAHTPTGLQRLPCLICIAILRATATQPSDDGEKT